MRNTKAFKIEGYEKQFEVRELTVAEIISLMSSEDGEDESPDTSIAEFAKRFDKVLLPLACNLDIEELKAMPPSDIMEIWDRFQEVNKSFFDLARAAGLDKTFTGLKEAIIADFSNLLVSSSSAGT